LFVDTHAHFSDPVFDSDREKLLAEIQAQGMPFMVDVGCTPEGSRTAVRLAEQYPWIYATCGVHPHDAEEYGVEGARQVIAELADHPRVVALGEMGLDFFYDNSPREIQKSVFRAQLQEARRREMPVVVHVRDSEEEALELLAEDGFPRGIWHCFSGSLSHAQTAVQGGMYISFSGILTFPRSKDLQETARILPEDCLLVETDSPYLTPVPMRKHRRNRPDYVNHTGKFLAELRGCDPQEMARILEENSRRVFGLGREP
jgi:TatD DNase family protein